MTHPSPGQLCPVLGHRLGIDARATYGVTGPPPATALGGPSSRRYGAGIADPDTAAAAGRVSQAGRPSRSARTSWRAGVWRFRPVPPPRVARVSRVAAVGGCRLALGSRRASADDGRCRPAQHQLIRPTLPPAEPGAPGVRWRTSTTPPSPPGSSAPTGGASPRATSKPSPTSSTWPTSFTPPPNTPSPDSAPSATRGATSPPGSAPPAKPPNNAGAYDARAPPATQTRGLMVPLAIGLMIMAPG